MSRSGIGSAGEGGSGPDGVGPPGASGSGPFPPALVRFAELFEEGRYWDSHEVLEGPWRTSGSPFYHGLILLASAWVHVGRENAHGIDAQLRKALDALEGVPGAYLGVDVEALRRAGRRGRQVVAEHRERPPRRWRERIPPPALTLSAERLRGDERELDHAPGSDDDAA